MEGGLRRRRTCQRDTVDEVIGPIVTNVLMELTKLPGENWLKDFYETQE